MTPGQCEEARRLLGWSRARLSGQSGIGLGVIEAFEGSGRVQSAMSPLDRADRLAAIRAALEAAGVAFTNGDAPGVKLRPSKL
jgi:hypothetical protein